MNFPQPASHARRSSPLLGRDALLRSLRERWSTESRMVIGVDPSLQSTTGVGRTRLVSELVQQMSNGDTAVLHWNGASHAAWRESLLQSTRQLGLRPQNFRRFSDLVGSLRGWLASHEQWVIVADSLPNFEALNEVTEGITTGHVMALLSQPMMSVSSDWSAPVPLGSLSTDDALQVLRVSIDRDWRNTQEVIAATQIVTQLECNPRSIGIAGRTMWLAEIGPTEYLQSLRPPRQIPPSLACLSLLMEIVEDRNPDAIGLLAAVVACGPVPIPVSLMSAFGSSIKALRNARTLLIDCGLLNEVGEGTHVVVAAHADLLKLIPSETLQAGALLAGAVIPHRVVRNRLREHVCGVLVIESDVLAVQRVAIGQMLAALPPLELEQIAIVRQAADAALDLHLPQVAQKLLLRSLEHLLKVKSPEDSLLSPLVELGAAYVMDEQFQLARRYWRQAVESRSVEHPQLTELLLAIAEIDVNENRLDRAAGRLSRVAEICNGLPATAHHTLLDAQRRYLKAGVLLGLGEAEKARDHFRTAVELRMSWLPVDHTLLMRNRLMLARTEFLLKNYQASEQILVDEVAIREASTNVSESELGVACNFLGEQYYLSGRLSDAEPVYQRALELRRTTLPRGHRLIGEMANRLAVIKSARGAYKDSDSLFRESLSHLEQTYGGDHPEVARALNDLAESLFAQNKIEPARRLLERALTIQEKSLRKNDARLGRTRCNLAAVYVARGRFVEAVRLYERDVAERQSYKVPDKASLATSLNNLAEALRSLGRNQEAEERLQQSLAIREEMVGPEHPQVAQILNNLGYLYLQQHRYPAASDCLQRALRIRETSLSAQHPHLATTLGTLAEVEFAQGRYAAARPLYSRAIDIFLGAYGERHPQVASLQVCSARNELRLGHVGRAELMLLRGKNTIEELLGADHRMSSKVLLGLSELAHSEKRYEPAFPMLERCLAIQLATMSSQRLEIAETLRLISDNLVARGLKSDALPRIVEAVELQRGMLGPRHAEIIPNMLRIGRIQQQLGNAASAEEALRFVLEHAEANTQSSLIDEAHEELPDVLIQLQQYDEAAERLRDKVQRLEARGESPMLLSTLSQLAGIHYLRSQLPVAAPLMERCVELSEQWHGPDSPETAKHLDNLAGVRFLLGQYESAEPAILRSIRILESERPVRPAALTKARENYIQLLKQTNRIHEADQISALLTTSPPVVEGAFLPSSHVLDDL